MSSFLLSKEKIRKDAINIPRQGMSYREGILEGRNPNSIGFPLDLLRTFQNLNDGFIQTLINMSADTRIGHSDFYTTREFIDPFVAAARNWAVNHSIEANVDDG
jgi:hypothetical protein